MSNSIRLVGLVCFIITLCQEGTGCKKVNDYIDWTFIRSTIVLITKKLMFEYSSVVFKNKIRIMKS